MGSVLSPGFIGKIEGGCFFFFLLSEPFLFRFGGVGSAEHGVEDADLWLYFSGVWRELWPTTILFQNSKFHGS